MEDNEQRRVAIQKLQLVRRFATQDKEPCTVLPGLHIGPVGAARNLDSLQSKGITHVLNASPVIPCFHKRQLRYKQVLVYDDPGEDISAFFSESNRFINKARKKGGVLVHCYAGQSRSAALVAAYLIAYEKMNVGAALSLIRQVRPCVQPNKGFIQQLYTYSQTPQLPPCSQDLHECAPVQSNSVCCQV